MKKSSLPAILLLFISFSALAQSTAKDWYDKGIDLKKDSKYEEAITAFKKAVSLKNDYNEALYQLGWCYNEKEMYKEALEVLQNEAKYNPTKPAASQFEMGYALKGLGQYDDAIEAFTKVLGLDEDYELAYKERGNCYYEKDEYEKALDDYNIYASMEDEISDEYYYYKKGWCENDMEKYEDAVKSLTKAIGLDDRYSAAYEELGWAQYNLSNDADAESAYRTANQTDPDMKRGLMGLVDVYKSGLKEYDSALVYAKKALQFYPENASLNYKAGWCYNEKEMYIQAIPYLQKALQINKDYLDAHLELGYASYKLKKYDEALAELKKVMSGDEKDELSRYYAGLCYHEKKDPSNLKKMIQELQTLGSDYAQELSDLLK